MKKVLITGGMGFAGKYLTVQLADEEVHVTRLENEPDCGIFAECHVLDICNSADTDSLIKQIQPDVIYHLAGQSSVAVSWKNPQLTVDVNIRGAVNLLEAVRKYSPESKVLLTGSSEEYGCTCLASENDHMFPENIYAVTKLSQEMLGKVYHNAYGLKTVMTRSFNHIGAGQLPVFAVSDFCRQTVRIEKGLAEPVIKTGNLSARRDFTDVRDIVNAYAALVQYGRDGEVYNVGSGNAVSLQSILEMIISFSSADIKIEKDPARFRPADVPEIKADISKITADTGWKPVIPLEQTIRNVLDYWRRNEDN